MQCVKKTAGCDPRRAQQLLEAVSYGPMILPLLMLSKASFAETWRPLFWLNQVAPLALDTVFWKSSMFMIVMLAAPPKPARTSSGWIRLINAPPIGTGWLIWLPPRAGSVKYTANAVASICALSIGLQVEPPQVAASITASAQSPTEPGAPLFGAFAKALNCRSQLPRVVWLTLSMIAWPFLLCQKPIVCPAIAQLET